MFARARLANGPGIHTDEASSALPDIAALLTTSQVHKLEARTTEVELPGDGVRANPRKRGRNAESIVPRAEAIELAFLVTGMWGPEAKTNLRDVPLRRRLPIAGARENPARSTRMTLTFWERMERLHAEIEALEQRAAKRYAKSATAPAKRTWPKAIEQMKTAVEHVLSQRSASRPSVVAEDGRLLGLPDGTWDPLSGEGNSKLPFVAYSELPMATCPGAGTCAVHLNGVTGFCYSFNAFTYSNAYKRMFLNTLANYADREFAIIYARGPSDPAKYVERAQAAIDGTEARLWPQVVKGLALKLTAADRIQGKTVFMRLFVDGDINYEDNIIEWMQVCRDIGPKGRDSVTGHGHIEVYGYTKCWQQFVNVDKYLSGDWPKNYTVNLSSGSVYISKGYKPVRDAMEKLPVSRGYFEAVNLAGYIKELKVQTDLLKKDPKSPVPMPPEGSFAWKFDPERTRMLLRINGIESLGEAQQIFPKLKPPVDSKGKPKVLDVDQVRRLTFQHFLDGLLRDKTFGKLVRAELQKDAGEGKKADSSPHGMRRKTLALVLHEVMWSYGLGGSCPLLCRNCSSHPTDPTLGVHRCADRGLFQGKTITIGLH